MEGNKKRAVSMGVASRRGLWRYMETERVEASPEEPLFVSVGGINNGSGMTRTGLHMIIQKAGKAGGVKSVRCSPQTLRHLVNFLRGGGNLFEFQQLMGHTDEQDDDAPRTLTKNEFIPLPDGLEDWDILSPRPTVTATQPCLRRGSKRPSRIYRDARGSSGAAGETNWKLKHPQHRNWPQPTMPIPEAVVLI